MPERRYTDTEVAEILRRATEQPTRLPSGSDGLTLAQIQDAGREAGIAPESVAAAAQAIDSAPQRSTRTVLGVPVGVAETVELGRLMTDDEWNALVSSARETFHAKGRVRQEGAFRSWTNGNLQLMLEPSGTGNRIRMRTTRGESPRIVPLLAGGAVIMGMLAIIGTVTDWAWAADRIDGARGMTAILLILLGVYGFRLAAWAQRRRAQFRQLGERLLDGR